MNEKNPRRRRISTPVHNASGIGRRQSSAEDRVRAAVFRLTLCRLILVGISLGLCTAARAVAAEPGLERFESTRPQMGVPFKIILYAPDSASANLAFEAAFSRVE